MKRGIIISLDVLAAVLLLILFLTMISFELNMPHETTWLAKLGEDYLAVLDKGGVLLNITEQNDNTALVTLQTYLNKLPGSVGANITVKIYTCSTGATNLKKDFNKIKGTVVFDRVTVRRVFTDPKDNECGLVILEMWHD
jgi:hypothetical protein